MNWKNLTLAALVAVSVGACEESRNRTGQRHTVPLPPEMYALFNEKGMTRDQPILIRSFKKESEIEVWKRRADGQFALLKTYPMCRWSGQLGPKKREGDRMAPEGFYDISPAQMNPNSSFYLAFNMGYPNAFDRSHGRTGAHLMVHGACSSSGCYSMTDDQIAELYALVREAHSGGQRSVQMQSFPFRMTAENLTKHRLDPNMPFWRNLKEGSDVFEATRTQPQVAVCNARYAFGRDSNCATIPQSESFAQAIASKRRDDDSRVAALVAKGTPAIKLVYDDGDQHDSFKRTLASSGASGLHAKASWASRDVGISRPEALTSGPRVVVLDSSGNARGTARATSASNDAVLAAASSAAISQPEVAAAPVAATPRPATPRTAVATAPAGPASAKPALRGTTEVAKTEAPAAPAADQRSIYQRAFSYVPFVGSSSEPAPAAAAAPVTAPVAAGAIRRPATAPRASLPAAE
ncbi:MAG: L,D-transpeptidase family protein [Bosea sp. (in: a-proteobacteria)]